MEPARAELEMAIQSTPFNAPVCPVYQNVDGLPHTDPEEIKNKHKTVFGIPFEYLTDAAARRQKWIDQSQSVNLFLATPDLKTLSHMYRRAWSMGLKTTYYLRTLQASNIEKSTIDVKKEVRGFAGNAKREFSAEEQQACSIDAMINGGECEACQ